MNGPHDLGGMQGFGQVCPEDDEPRFHAEWERRTCALTLAMGATKQWNLDMTRAARESLPAAVYLASSYYQIWLEALTKQLVGAALATAQEVREGVAGAPSSSVVRPLGAEQMIKALKKGNSTARKVATCAQFKVGDTVRTRKINPLGHTRLPRYCRGRIGTVIMMHGAHVFPDTHAAGFGEQPQWLYTVRFEGQELWGQDTTAAAVCVDCWEPYLEAP